MNHKFKHIIAFLTGCLLLFGGAVNVLAAGKLSVAVSSGTVKTGDTVTVTVYAVNANNEDVIADMSVTYDTSILEYISSSDTNAGYGNGKVNAKGSSVSIKFKAVASGDAYVKAEGATLTAAGTHINVTGGAGASDTSVDEEQEDGNTVKSGDNSLSSLTISPGTLSPAFKGSVTEYTAEVGGDVSEINVNPVTSNSKATIESVSGNKDLKTGTNVITVSVKAENGTKADYKITVTKGESSTPTSAEVPTASSDQPKEPEEKPNENDSEEKPAESGSGGNIEIDGVTYQITDEIPEEEIPAGFSKSHFEYKGERHTGVVFDHGHLGMYYLTNEAKESRFFVYDADRDRFFPYVRLVSGDHYIVLMAVPNAAIPPENYKETTVVIGDMTLTAHQFAGPADKEIVKFDNPEEEAAYNAESDFYLFYAMDETGEPGWYQYDSKQGTYQRFNQDAILPADEGKNYDTLLMSYNELDERYDNVRTRDRRLIGGLIFGAVVLLLLVINLLLKIRELKLDGAGAYEEEERPRKKHRTPKTHSKAKTRTKTRTKTRADRVEMEEPDIGQDFYDADDKDIIDEFEEDPEIISSRKKKEKEARQRRQYVDVAPIRTKKQDTDNDDIEFLDLN